MATIYRCDRCKETFERREEVRPIELERPGHRDYDFASHEGGDPMTKELCIKCYRVIWAAMQTPPKETQA